MLLAQPLWLLLLLLLPVPWVLLRRKGSVGHSDVKLFKGISQWSIFEKLSLVLFSLVYVALVLALSRPQKMHVEAMEGTRSRDIIIAVDISGSMGYTFEGEIPKREGGATGLYKDLPARPVTGTGDAIRAHSDPTDKLIQRRIDAAQGAILRFVENRFAANAGDRIGLETFDTEPHWRWPLTHDLKMIYRYGLYIDEGLGGGTNFGEQKPGPIDAAAEHFDELGKSSSRVLIMVTDGEDQLSDRALARLKVVIQSHHMRFYVIGVGETLAKQHVDIMTLAESVNGKVHRVENAKSLAECFDNIDQMERSIIQVDSTTKYDDVFYYAAGTAALLLLLALLAEALILGQ